MKSIILLCLLIFHPNHILLAPTSSSTNSYDYSSYSATSTNMNLSGESISSTTSGQSAVYISNTGITITDSTITKSGDYSDSSESTEFYGVNAAVLVQGGGLTMTGGTIETSAIGGNAIVVTNQGTVEISGTTIKSTASSSARGLHATYGGSITASKVTISTTGGSCASLATDRGEGTVTCTGCTLSTSGSGSPLIYSTGSITIKDTTGTASGAQAVVVEGRNSASVASSTLKTSGSGNNRDDECGVFIYQSQSGDAESGTGSFICDSSTIEILSTSSYYSSAPFFYVTNTEADIALTNCTLTFGSGKFILVDEGDWGTSGSNGGTVTMTLTNQDIVGNIVVGSSSSLTLKLVKSSIKGTINSGKTAAKLDITLDADSTITLTGNSYYTSLTNSNSDSSNIVSGDYTWGTYDESSISSTTTSTNSSSSTPSSPSSGGSPPDKPDGTNQIEPAQSGTPPEKPDGTDQSGTPSEKPDGTDQSGTPPEKPDGTDQSGTPSEKPDGTDQSGTPSEKPDGTDQSGTPPEKPDGTDQSGTPPEKPDGTDVSESDANTNTTNSTNTDNSTNSNTSSTNFSVVLLGYSNYNTSSESISFFIYFVSLLNSIKPKKLSFPLQISRNTGLRFLQDAENIQSNCDLQDSNSGTKLQYKCEVETDTSNIKQIKIEPSFYFDNQKVNPTGITSSANAYMDNLQDIGDKFDYLSSSNIYILDHSIYNKKDNNAFEISGIMSDPQPSFSTNDLILQINTESSGTTIEKNISCTITNTQGKNYTLNCQSDESIDADDLQSASSIIGNDVLLVNFDAYNEEEPSSESESDKVFNRRFINKSSNGLNAGGIVAIVLASIAALAALIGVFFCLRKGSLPKNNINEAITNKSLNPTTY